MMGSRGSAAMKKPGARKRGRGSALQQRKRREEGKWNNVSSHCEI
jgi:hypothetical protein